MKISTLATTSLHKRGSWSNLLYNTKATPALLEFDWDITILFQLTNWGKIIHRQKQCNNESAKDNQPVGW